jgi:predicted Rossmann fold nucleotide-binding protein DprA/Smf involved in DNA uptake
MLLRKVVSGGQTGVDRAALDAAMNAGIPVGG